jgi:hypothetical protein
MIKTHKIGDIALSRFYIGLEVRPYKSDKARVFLGPTYHGTFTGVIVTAGKLSLLAHIRRSNERTTHT